MGRSSLEKLLNKDHRIFLDLKLHDIPNTVLWCHERTWQGFDLELINVHAAGGKMMMERAMEGLMPALQPIISAQI